MSESIEIMAATYMLPWKLLQRSKSNGDGRIQMGSRDVTRRQDHNHHRKAGGGRQPNQCFGSFRLLVHDGRGGSGKDEYRGTYELRSHLLARTEATFIYIIFLF